MKWQRRRDGNYLAFQITSRERKSVFRTSRCSAGLREHPYWTIRLSGSIPTDIRFIQQVDDMRSSRENPEALFPTSVLEESDRGCFQISEDR